MPEREQDSLDRLDDACRAYWEDAARELDGLPGGRGLNIAHEALDRHARGERAGQAALRWLGPGGERRELDYAALAALTSRFANVLAALGVGRGERVFTLLERVPELYVAALGALKHGAVYCPLFSAFGPEPVHTRMHLGRARVLVTSEALYRRKVAPVRERLPALEHVLLVRAPHADALPPATLDLAERLEAASEDYETAPTQAGDLALLHFTSGTTGRPKGAMHVHGAVAAHRATARLALDLRPGDVFWCTADPGWVTGTSYGIIAPLALGATVLSDALDFDAERWLDILERERVDVWYTAPTAVRMLMRSGGDLVQGRDLPRLRFIASVGEALPPDAVRWSEAAFGQPIHDNWWQTETGCIMIANTAKTRVKPGSMGKPLPGVEAAVVRGAGDAVDVVETPGETGELALRPGWPSMFRGYLDDEERYRRCFAGGWYLSGDLVRRDADGYYWFVGRSDDVIKSSGHLIGPAEVEHALLEHPAVADAAVIGKPDAVAGEIVKAFVVLAAGHEATSATGRDLRRHARGLLGVVVAPKEIAFVDRLPKNRSGKIMRRVLKARETGEPTGDLSTLDESG